MKRALLIAMFMALLPHLWAVSATLTTNASTCPVSTNTTALIANFPQDKGGATLTVSGTWTGTISFKGSGDGGTTWTAMNVTPLGSSTQVTSSTGNGTWQVNTAGFTGICMLSSAAMTGSATVTVTPSAASARNGGGGGSGTITNIATTSPITGGPITSTGTIGCATCAIGPGTSTANHLASFSGTDGITLADAAPVATTATASAVVKTLAGGTIDPSFITAMIPIYNVTKSGISMISGTGANTNVTGAECTSGICTMTTPGADGYYLLYYQIYETTVGSGGTCTTGQTRLDMGYKAGNGSTYPNTTLSAPLYAVSSVSASSTATFVAVGVGSATDYFSGPKMFLAKSGTAITYEIEQAIASNCTTPPVFSVHIMLFGPFPVGS